MESITKATLTRQDILSLGEKAFPGCDITEVRELSEGMFNSAYYLAGTGAMSGGVILKVGPREGTKLLTYEKEILRTEVAVCRMLEGANVPAPKVLYADYTHAEIPCDWFFMSCIPGILWKNADKEVLARSRGRLMEQLGQINARIHSVPGTHFGYIKEDSRFRFDSWADAFENMMQDVCDDGKRDGQDLPYAEILSAVRRHRALLNTVTSPSLVDFDLWAGNVLLTEEDGFYSISGIIDFERSFFGDPYAEFISAWDIYENVQEEPEFLAGYGKPIIPDESARIRMTLYRLYLTVIMHVETYRYEAEYAAGLKAWLLEQILQLLQQLG